MASKPMRLRIVRVDGTEGGRSRDGVYRGVDENTLSGSENTLSGSMGTCGWASGVLCYSAETNMPAIKRSGKRRVSKLVEGRDLLAE